MTRPLSDSELEAYLDEALSPEEMARVETAVRDSSELLQRLAEINGRRDAGVHSLGAIWRRHRASCPTREQMGSFLLGVLDEQHSQYIRFHLETIGCRLCQANIEDLQRRQRERDEYATVRRKRYFDSSAGYLNRDSDS